MAQAKRISDLPEFVVAADADVLEVSTTSATVTITAATISADAVDDSFNDSGSGFLTAGFAVNDRIVVSGFANGTNNIFVGTISSVTAGKIITDITPLVTEAAGPSVTISKRVSGRITLENLATVVQNVAGIDLQTTLITNTDVTDTMLGGNGYVQIDSAGAVIITVPDTLTGLQPCTFEAIGTGTVTFAAGGTTTINSSGSLLDIGGQYEVVTLVPKGSGTYSLIGSLA